jgi:hypothetical protein
VDVSDDVGGLADKGGGVDDGGEPVEASNHGDGGAALGSAYGNEQSNHLYRGDCFGSSFIGPAPWGRP